MDLSNMKDRQQQTRSYKLDKVLEQEFLQRKNDKQNKMNSFASYQVVEKVKMMFKIHFIPYSSTRGHMIHFALQTTKISYKPV